MTLFTAVICAYIVTVQQIFGEVYGLGDWLPIAFAGTAGGIAVANFANGYLCPQLRHAPHLACRDDPVHAAFRCRAPHVARRHAVLPALPTCCSRSC